MKNYLKKYFLFFIPIIIGFSGCLKDNASPVFNATLSDNALLLQYLEQSGDYINSPNMPSVVGADEVHNNLDNYLIVDTRTNPEYVTGHIPGAINVTNDSLITFLNSANVSIYPKVVIVSSDGQASSYYTCLLRLYGISNTYSLLFGMAHWNSYFASIWTENIGDDISLTNDFQFGAYSNDSLSSLPNVILSNSESTLEKKVKIRIADLIKAGFVNNDSYVRVDPAGKLLFNGEPVSNFYIVCYGIYPFYLQNIMDPLAVGHFPNAVSFVPEKNLKSTDNLQLLPDKKRIVVYSYSGQLSAFVVAYLRVLGYDARSLLYGANKLFYSFMVDKQSAYEPFVFLASEIRDYTYITSTYPK
jgi:rhodanese-related sulfurtransferase